MKIINKINFQILKSLISNEFLIEKYLKISFVLIKIKNL